MNSAPIKELYREFKAMPDPTPGSMIDFFSANHLFFDNLAGFNDAAEVTLYIELTWHYMNALTKKERYNDTVDTAIKHLTLIDSEIKRFKLLALRDDWYYGVLFMEGAASYNLRDFKTATTIFRKLVAHDPQNDSYNSWLVYSKYRQKLWVTYSIWAVSIGIMSVDLFFHELIPWRGVRLTLLAIGFIGFVTNIVWDYFIKRSFRKKKKFTSAP